MPRTCGKPLFKSLPHNRASAELLRCATSRHVDSFNPVSGKSFEQGDSYSCVPVGSHQDELRDTAVRKKLHGLVELASLLETASNHAVPGLEFVEGSHGMEA